jgi:hypothetical protein
VNPSGWGFLDALGGGAAGTAIASLVWWLRERKRDVDNSLDLRRQRVLEGADLIMKHAEALSKEIDGLRVRLSTLEAELATTQAALKATERNCDDLLLILAKNGIKVPALVKKNIRSHTGTMR